MALAARVIVSNMGPGPLKMDRYKQNPDGSWPATPTPTTIAPNSVVEVNVDDGEQWGLEPQPVSPP